MIDRIREAMAAVAIVFILWAVMAAAASLDLQAGLWTH